MTGGGGSRTDPSKVRSPKKPTTGGKGPPTGSQPPPTGGGGGGGGEGPDDEDTGKGGAPAGGGMPEGAGDDGENISSEDVPDEDTVTSGPGEGAGQTAPRCSVVPPREGVSVGEDGYSGLLATPTANAQSQRRDPTNKVPCMHSTKGTLLPDGSRTDYGYDALQLIPGLGLIMGGFPS